MAILSDVPIIPGPEMDHNMAELCFRNGAECMKKRVLQMLDDIIVGTMGITRASVTAVRVVIEEMDPVP